MSGTAAGVRLPLEPPGAIDSAALAAAAGLVVHDRFLSDEQIAGLRACARARAAGGQFRPARVGSPQRLERRAAVRGDSICWLEPPLYPAEQILAERLEALRLKLNREALLGLFELELHYAIYPPGTHYARHRDQPHGRTERRVSIVLYLNEAWSSAAGGALRIDAAEGLREIEPLGGRLVLFSAPDCEHEVLPTHRERLSLTGWFRRRASP